MFERPGGTSYATGIDDSVQVTGWSDTLQFGTSDPRPDHVFIYENGQMTDLGSLSATGELRTLATGLRSMLLANDGLECDGLVRDACFYFFRWHDGGPWHAWRIGSPRQRGRRCRPDRRLEFPPDDSAAHAFLIDSGGMMDLGTASGSSNSYAFGIDAAGTLIGTLPRRSRRPSRLVLRRGTRQSQHLYRHISADRDAGDSDQ